MVKILHAPPIRSKKAGEGVIKVQVRLSSPLNAALERWYEEHAIPVKQKSKIISTAIIDLVNSSDPAEIVLSDILNKEQGVVNKIYNLSPQSSDFLNRLASIIENTFPNYVDIHSKVIRAAIKYLVYRDSYEMLSNDICFVEEESEV